MFAIQNDDGTATICTGSPFEALAPTANVVELTDLDVLAPIIPGKIVGVGLNYLGHAARTPKARAGAATDLLQAAERGRGSR